MTKLHQGDQNEPFFLTEEVEAELIVAGHVFEPPPIVCTGRLHDVLERMSDVELALQPGEIVDQERKRRKNKSFSVG